MLNTKDIQRELLSILLNQKMLAKLRLSQVEDKWFTDKKRKWILNNAKDILKYTNSLFTDKLFELELEKGVDEKFRDSYRTEWNIIQGTSIDNSAEVLIEKLKESILFSDLTSILSDTAGFLEKGELEKAIGLLKEKSVGLNSSRFTEKPLELITDYEPREATIKDKKDNPWKYKGISSGFKQFDKLTGGFFKAELTLISAVTGVGKSTFMKQIAFNIINYGKNVLFITNEESREQVSMKFDSLVTGIDYKEFKFATIEDTDIGEWKTKMIKMKGKRFGKLFIKELPPYSNVIEIERVYQELSQIGENIDIIFIDYLDHLTCVQKPWSENDEQAKTAIDCKGLAVNLDLPVVTATQAATAAESKQSKGSSFGKLDVYGSKRKVHEANTLIFVIQDEQDLDQLVENGGDREHEYQCDWFWILDIAKSRDSSPFHLKAKQKVRTGRVEEIGFSTSISEVVEELKKEI